jgi:hypothetical protein
MTGNPTVYHDCGEYKGYPAKYGENLRHPKDLQPVLNAPRAIPVHQCEGKTLRVIWETSAAVTYPGGHAHKKLDQGDHFIMLHGKQGPKQRLYSRPGDPV